MNVDELDNLQNVLEDTEGTKAFMRAMEEVAIELRDKIHDIPIGGEDPGRKLLEYRLRTDGAWKLLDEFKRVINLRKDKQEV